MSHIPECEYRVPIEGSKKFYCRHTRVHARGNQVTAEICRLCTQRTVACPDPRPLPTPEDLVLKEAPPLKRQLWNFTKAITEFVADGLKTVSQEEYAARLAICEDCEERRGNRCLKCGCRLSWKARGRAFQCPLEKWPIQESSESEAEPEGD